MLLQCVLHVSGDANIGDTVFSLTLSPLTLYSNFDYFYIYQEPTDIPSRKKLMRWVYARGWCVPEVGVSEEGVYCKIIFL